LGEGPQEDWLKKEENRQQNQKKSGEGEEVRPGATGPAPQRRMKRREDKSP